VSHQSNSKQRPMTGIVKNKVNVRYLDKNMQNHMNS